MLSRYKTLKEQILKLANEAKNNSDIPEEIKEFSNIANETNDLIKGIFRIAVIAPFNAGKTTFVNALLGTDLLSINMLAETAVITRIKYAEKPRLTVVYNSDEDELIDQLPSPGQSLSTQELKEILRLITTVIRNPEQEEKIKEYLKNYDSAKGVGVEERVKEVIVYWNLDLCKDGVEIIDTPGLFARFEKHNDITKRILPEAKAVVFVLEPERIGEANFTAEIRRYVQEAQNSNMERKSRHIFFLLNKIDQHLDKYDIAVQEIKDALDGIISDPQILGVSAFNALIARRYKNGELELTEIQNMIPPISVIDPQNGNSVVGAAIQEEHIPLLLDISRIQQVESDLEQYLEKRYLYLIENVAIAVRAMYQKAIEQVDIDVQTINNYINKTEDNYEVKLADARKKLQDLRGNLDIKLEKAVSNSAKELRNKAKQLMKKEQQKLQEDMNKHAFKLHSQRINSLDQYSANNILHEFNVEAGRYAQVQAKKILKNVYDVVDKDFKYLIYDLKSTFKKMDIEINEIISGEMGVNINSISDSFNVNIIQQKTVSKLGGVFQQHIEWVASGFQNTVSVAIDQSKRYESKPGLINKILSIFGVDNKQQRLNLTVFKEEISAALKDVFKTHFINTAGVLNDILDRLDNEVQDLEYALKKDISQIVNYEIEGRRRHLKRLKDELTNEVNTLDQSIANKQAAKQRMIENYQIAETFERQLAESDQ